MRSHVSLILIQKGTEKRKWKKEGGQKKKEDSEGKSKGKTVRRSNDKSRNAGSHRKPTGVGMNFPVDLPKGAQPD